MYSGVIAASDSLLAVTVISQAIYLSYTLLYLHLCLAHRYNSNTLAHSEPQHAITKIVFAKNSRGNLTLARSMYFYGNSGKNLAVVVCECVWGVS